MKNKKPEEDWKEWLLDPGFSSANAAKLILAAKDGDREAAELILAGFSWFAKIGLAQPREVKFYLAQAFDRILNGADPTEALYLKRGAGRPSKPEMSPEAVAIFADMAKAMASGQTYESALWEVSQARGIGERTAGRAYSRIKKRLTESG